MISPSSNQIKPESSTNQEAESGSGIESRLKAAIRSAVLSTLTLDRPVHLSCVAIISPECSPFQPLSLPAAVDDETISFYLNETLHGSLAAHHAHDAHQTAPAPSSKRRKSVNPTRLETRTCDDLPGWREQSAHDDNSEEMMVMPTGSAVDCESPGVQQTPLSDSSADSSISRHHDNSRLEITAGGSSAGQLDAANSNQSDVTRPQRPNVDTGSLINTLLKTILAGGKLPLPSTMETPVVHPRSFSSDNFILASLGLGMPPQTSISSCEPYSGEAVTCTNNLAGQFYHQQTYKSSQMKADSMKMPVYSAAPSLAASLECDRTTSGLNDILSSFCLSAGLNRSSSMLCNGSAGHHRNPASIQLSSSSRNPSSATATLPQSNRKRKLTTTPLVPVSSASFMRPALALPGSDSAVGGGAGGGAGGSTAGSKTFRCNQCKRTFPSLNALCEHTFEAHGSFRCTICGSKFTQRSNLQRHALKHVGFKPFECGVCGKAYFRKDHSIRHVEVTHPQCDPKASIRCHLTSSQCLDFLEAMERSGKITPLSTVVVCEPSVCVRVEEESAAALDLMWPGNAGSEVNLEGISQEDEEEEEEEEEDVDSSGDHPATSATLDPNSSSGSPSLSHELTAPLPVLTSTALNLMDDGKSIVDRRSASIYPVDSPDCGAMDLSAVTN